MSQRDYYEVLSVERGASGEDIKKAYRKMACSTIRTEIPAMLRPRQSSRKRPKPTMCCETRTSAPTYDRFGHAGLGQLGPFQSNEDIFSQLGDIFSDLFGFSMGGQARGRRNRAQQGADLRYNLGISFHQAAKATTSASRSRVAPPALTAKAPARRPAPARKVVAPAAA